MIPSHRKLPVDRPRSMVDNIPGCCGMLEGPSRPIHSEAYKITYRRSCIGRYQLHISLAREFRSLIDAKMKQTFPDPKDTRKEAGMRSRLKFANRLK